jgi:hypothetical protein
MRVRDYIFVMLLSPRLRTLLLVAIALPASSQIFLAQDIPADKKVELLTAAQSKYYNLRTAGLKSFSCKVDIDWNAFFISTNGKALPADDPMQKYLSNSQLLVNSDLDGHTDLSWANTGAPPQGSEENANQLRDSMKGMLGGFFGTWLPSLSGALIPPAASSSIKATPAGYIVDGSAGKETELLTMDKQLVIQHLSAKSETSATEIDISFTPSSSGLLLTKLDNITHEPPTGPPTHIVMSTTFQPVASFQLPDSLTVVLTNVGTFKMRLTGCTVQKQS